MGPRASCAQTGGLLWPPPGRPHSRWLGACSLTAALQGTHTASGREGASPRRRAASASASRVLCRSEDARWGPFPGRPGAVSTARAAARCSEASTPEDGPARPSVLQLRTLLRLLMSQPRGTSCDKSAPAGKPVGGCRAPSEGEEPLSHSVFLPRVLFRSRHLLAPHTSSERALAPSFLPRCFTTIGGRPPSCAAGEPTGGASAWGRTSPGTLGVRRLLLASCPLHVPAASGRRGRSL